MRSSHFRFYIFEEIIIEEIDDRDPQAIAQLLDRRNGCTVVAATDYIIHGRLSNAADRAKLVNSQVAFCT